MKRKRMNNALGKWGFHVPQLQKYTREQEQRLRIVLSMGKRFVFLAEIINFVMAPLGNAAERSAVKQCSKAENAVKSEVVGRKETERMKVAVTYENGAVFPHFGHTEQFKLYTIENGSIADTQIVDTNGSGHGALAGLLSDLNVNILICGGIGMGAQNALEEAGIQLYGGVSDTADEAVNALLAGNLKFDFKVHCEHHKHHKEEHHCGENKQGCQGNGGICR